MDWFLYDRGLRHENVNASNSRRKLHCTSKKLLPAISRVKGEKARYEKHINALKEKFKQKHESAVWSAVKHLL